MVPILYALFALLILLQIAIDQSVQRRNEITPAAVTNAPRRSLFQAILMRMGRVNPGAAMETVPGMELAKQRTQQSRACAVTVGGAHAPYVTARLDTARYFSYKRVVSARELEGGARLQVIYAIADPVMRNVGLLDPFDSPESALTETAAGGLERRDTLREFERVHGLRVGSVTTLILQAIVLLHEAGHLNQALPSDSGDFAISMANTNRVIRACFPSLIQPAAATATPTAQQ